MIRLLDVYYAGWGEDWRLGQLADDGQQLLFEYTSEALAQGLELSPLQLKLRAAAYGQFPSFQFRLPGLIADALPDGWGLLLMDRWFRPQAARSAVGQTIRPQAARSAVGQTIRPQAARSAVGPASSPTPLERLAFIGARAMGALRFEPAELDLLTPPDWDLLTLARHSLHIVAGESSTVLRELAVTGGSPQGARPKALVTVDTSTWRVSTDIGAVGAPWLVKFPAQHEHPEVCAIEALYLDLALSCGIETPSCKLFELTPKLSAIGLERFDRMRIDNEPNDAQIAPKPALRVPIHSLASLLDADFRQPGSVDYASLLRVTRTLTRDEREVENAFKRAVFNAIFHNRDDHPKNIAFRLGRDRRWRLAPAFDLTFSQGPGGQHHMDFAGRGSDIRRADLIKLASAGGLSQDTCNAAIDAVAAAANGLANRAKNYPIRAASMRQLQATVAQCCKLACT
jgi:serine/threonine-protein kinase HipA